MKKRETNLLTENKTRKTFPRQECLGTTERWSNVELYLVNSLSLSVLNLAYSKRLDLAWVVTHLAVGGLRLNLLLVLRFSLVVRK